MVNHPQDNRHYAEKVIRIRIMLDFKNTMDLFLKLHFMY